MRSVHSELIARPSLSAEWEAAADTPAQQAAITRNATALRTAYAQGHQDHFEVATL